MDYKVEHIGIAVKNLQTSIPLFEKLLGSPCYKTENIASEQVNTAFFLKQNSKIELLESTDPDGVIAKFIDKKGEKAEDDAHGVVSTDGAGGCFDRAEFADG